MSESNVDEIRRSFEELLALRQQDSRDTNVALLTSAYETACAAHTGQTRDDGKPYVTHSIAVARILVELGVDDVAIAAGLLHDVVEDTPVTLDEIRTTFGDEIATIVDGVSKLEDPTEQVFADRKAMPDDTRAVLRGQETRRELVKRAENLHRLLLAMSGEPRIVIVKLADRLHNMRTLGALERPDRLRIAEETLALFAPLAHRVGMARVKAELEDLAFATLCPDEYRRLARLVDQTRAERQSEVEEAIAVLTARLEEEGVHNATVLGRPKHLYSIYRKMETQQLPFDEIYDLIALRIIVYTKQQCYVALGVVSNLWQPMPGMFADYIAQPKPNGYQSLHTKVIGPRGKPLEIQIRTWAMHRTAEFGIAAHWAYKEQGDGAIPDRTIPKSLAESLRRILEPSTERTAVSFLTEVLNDFSTEQIFVFTPKRDVMDLPKGSTPIDFAYRVHSDVGNHAVGAIVNGRMVPLTHELQSGDIVEIITRKSGAPSRDWLAVVKTSDARAKIRSYFRKQAEAECADRGRSALLEEAKRRKIPLKLVRDEAVREIAPTFNRNSESEVYASIGHGLVDPVTVLNRLPAVKALHQEQAVAEATRPVPSVRDLTGVPYRRARCCLPLPGDAVRAYVSRGQGYSLHRADCPNLKRLEEQDPERVVTQEYPMKPNQTLTTPIRVLVADRYAILQEVAMQISGTRTFIDGVRSQSHRDKTATLDFKVALRDVQHLADVTAAIQRVPDVISVERLWSLW